MGGHNNVIPNNHFKKKWQFYVKTWFNQPARKLRRRQARAAKAEKLFPRPAGGVLRPMVRGQTVKYNIKTKLGRGFTLEELKENVNRLKAYRSNLVILPPHRRSKKPKAHEASEADRKTVQQTTGTVMPLAAEKQTQEIVKITSDMKKAPAYSKLRVERMNARLVGIRAKKAKESEGKEAKEGEAKAE